MLNSGPRQLWGEINQIELAHERTKQGTDALAEEEQAALRSELGKLMRTVRIESPEAIYDESAAAQTFNEDKTIDLQVGEEEFSKIEDV